MRGQWSAREHGSLNEYDEAKLRLLTLLICEPHLGDVCLCVDDPKPSGACWKSAMMSSVNLDEDIERGLCLRVPLHAGQNTAFLSARCLFGGIQRQPRAQKRYAPPRQISQSVFHVAELRLSLFSQPMMDCPGIQCCDDLPEKEPHCGTSTE